MALGGIYCRASQHYLLCNFRTDACTHIPFKFGTNMKVAVGLVMVMAFLRVLLDIIRWHHIAGIDETRTDYMDRLMIDLSASHKLIGNTSIPHGCAGRRGFGAVVVAANSCADFLTLHEVLQSLQCVWVCCKGSLFGLAQNAICALVLFTFRPRVKLFHVHK